MSFAQGLRTRSTAKRAVAESPPVNGPSRPMLLRAADRHEYDRDAACLIGPGSDEFQAVRFRPTRVASRQTAAWRGLSGEVIRIASQDFFESDYHGPCHLLILYR
ncbi:MAG: hypothetical protein JWM91_3995, partial [Rhodospirillales bacterium]|nr:hypothetical protein [Rhodospirillales bacterium]